jgi:hypothetical protein
MNDRLFEAADRSRGRSAEPMAMFAVAVYDHGPSAAPDERYEAQVASYPVVREAGASPWEAVRRLVIEHRVLLERHWSTGGSGVVIAARGPIGNLLETRCFWVVAETAGSVRGWWFRRMCRRRSTGGEVCPWATCGLVRP